MRDITARDLITLVLLSWAVAGIGLLLVPLGMSGAPPQIVANEP